MVTLPKPLLQTTVLEPPAEATLVDELVLLHGWGTDSRIWHLLAPLLRHRCRIHLVDLPGFGANAAINLWRDEAALIAALAAVLPVKAHIVGWSLGGNVARAYASRMPERVQSLALVACSPSFVARDDHPAAMSLADFSLFAQAVDDNPRRALGRFAQLQCQGDSRARELRQALRHLPGGEVEQSASVLRDALAYLGVVDQRRMGLGGALAMSPEPHYILGECDALVPCGVAAQLDRVTLLPGVAHLPMLSDPDGLAHLLLDEVRQHPLPEQVARKRRVARSFSAAADSYDSVAELQRQVGARVLDHHIRQPAEAGVGLDLGCGTGMLLGQLQRLEPGCRWVGGDIALGMLRYIRRRGSAPNSGLLTLDAECLPLADASIDRMVSNLAVQWCQDLDALFSEVARVLAPGGRMVFSTLVGGTLGELRQAWAEVDEHAHVNDFYRVSQWSGAVARARLQSVLWQEEQCITRYDELSQLVHELKALGAHNVNEGRLQGLTGRRHWRALRQAYEARRADGQLPASWQLLYGVVERPKDAL